MKPTDFRNATFESIRDGLDGSRRYTYLLYKTFGPCTTRDAAQSSSAQGRSEPISILTVRPRTTELVAMGLLELSPDQPDPRNGRYQCTTPKRFEQIRAERCRNEQMALI